MTAAYVDSSVLVGIAFGERRAAAVARRLRNFTRLVAAPLLEAELLSALRREDRDLDEGWLTAVTWVQPDRSLRPEIGRVLSAGYVRGADCWHLATALYLAEEPASLSFLTLDLRQGKVASKLGFAA